jgi:hypothetical protein
LAPLKPELNSVSAKLAQSSENFQENPFRSFPQLNGDL